MPVEVVSAKEIDAGLAETWRALQANNPALGSPYFGPRYTQLTAEVRDNVYVGILREAGEVVALLPFQRVFRRVGWPVSGPMSDYQAIICAQGTRFDVRAFLRGCGLDMLEFDHLVASQPHLRPFHRAVAASPIIDVSGGYDAYVEERRKAGSKNIKKINRMARVLERDVGEVRYERHVLDREVLDKLVAWKRYQCKTTGTPDLFAQGWTLDLLRRIYETQEEDFAGVLSAVWAGDELAAAHMGMRSNRVWHYWFPSYNRDLHSFSPGLVLLLWMVEQAPELGLEYIDLGKGDSQYKDRLKNGEILVAEGRLALPSVTTLVTLASEGGARLMRRLPFEQASTYGDKALYHVRRWAQNH